MNTHRLSRRAVAIGLAATGLAACAQRTPRFTDSNGATLTDSIAEETWLPMKGAKEYLLVRGRSMQAPAALFIHGGPGGAETPLMRLFNAALEDELVMAYWEQRGAGRSYDPDISPDTMTIPQFLDDLDVVVDHLRSRLGKKSVWLIGHSWGSALGVLYSHAHPEKVSGYIGTGQIASNPADEMHAYEFVLGEARKRGDRDALEKLNEIGPPPYTFDQLVVRDGLLDAYGGTFHRPIDKFAVTLRALFGTPEADVRDLWRLWRGLQFSQRALWPSFARLDLTKEASTFRVPLTFVLGRYDQRTWSPLAAAYLDQIKAPEKRLIWLEQSAHNGPFEEPEAFQRAVRASILNA